MAKALLISVLLSVCSSSVYSLALPRDDDGYILALQVVQNPIWGNNSYNHATMFKVGLDGSISKWWNVSFNEDIGPISYGAFAFDSTKNIVYLPTIGRITGVSQDGTVTINKTLQTRNQFWNYLYESQSDTLVGSCSDTTGSGKNNPLWYWCQLDVKTGGLKRSAFRLPYTDGPNGLDSGLPLYSVDREHQIIWYKPYIQSFVVGANYTTGKILFTTGNAYPSCIAYNGLTNKAYILAGNDISMYYDLSVYELLQRPQPPKQLVKLRQDPNFVIAPFGSCGIIPETNTLYAFMNNVTTGIIYNTLMPTDLILVDLTKLSFKQVSLESSKWRSTAILTGIRYVPPQMN